MVRSHLPEPSAKLKEVRDAGSNPVRLPSWDAVAQSVEYHTGEASVRVRSRFMRVAQLAERSITNFNVREVVGSSPTLPLEASPRLLQHRGEVEDG